MKRRSNLRDLLTTTIEVRASGEADSREFTGIGVPYGEVIDLGWGESETFDPGSIEVHEQGLLVLWQHDRTVPIGRVIEFRDTDAGFEIVGRLSTTPAAEDAYTLLKDGTITRLSIGFEPGDYRWDDETGVLHWTRVTGREFSLVSFPAYDTAAISDVRSAPTTARMARPNPKGITMEDDDTTDLTGQITALTGTVTDLSRALDQLRAGTPTGPSSPTVRYRSFGEYVKDAASKDAEAQERAAQFRRDFAGGVYGDGIDLPNWLGMLQRDMSAKQPVTNLFTHTHDLPAKGNKLEYGFVAEDTTQVAEQVAESDELLFGKVTLDTDLADVRTYGGYTTHSAQWIDRSPVSLVDLTWGALGRRYARNIEAVTRLKAAAAITAAEATPTVTVTAELDALSVDQWIGIVLDLVEAADESDWPLDGLLLSKTVFRALAALGESKKALSIAAAPTDKIGTIQLPKASGEMLKLPFVMFPGQPGKHISGFASSALFVQESAGAPLKLTDNDVTHLTGAYSVYGYAAHYVPGPTAFRAVKKA